MFSIHSLYASPMGNPYPNGSDLGGDNNGALCFQPVFPQNQFYQHLQTRAGNIRNFENFPRETQLELKSIVSLETQTEENFLSPNVNELPHPGVNNVTPCHSLQTDDKLKDNDDETVSPQRRANSRSNIGNTNNNNTKSTNNTNGINNSTNNSPVGQNWDEKGESIDKNKTDLNESCIDGDCSPNPNDEEESKLHETISDEGINCWLGEAVIKEEKIDGLAVGSLGWSGSGVVVDVKGEKGGESKAFKCHLCRKAFSRRANLRNHERAHWNGKQHACPHCGKLFSHRAHLVIHERTHTGEKPFLCPVCPKHFAQKVHLQNHARTHTGEKPYRCRFCSKAFAQRDHLNNHERIHTGEKPFTCARCSKSFTQRGHLKNHQRTHTGEAPFKCTMCSKAFVQRSHLNNHERTHNINNNNNNNNDIPNSAGCGISNSDNSNSNSLCSQHGCRLRVNGDQSHCHIHDEPQDNSTTMLCHDISNCSNGGCFSCDRQLPTSVVVKVEAKSFDECDEADNQQQQQCNHGNNCHFSDCTYNQLQAVGAHSHNGCTCGCNPIPSCLHPSHPLHTTTPLPCSHLTLNPAAIGNCNLDGFMTPCKKEFFDSAQGDDAKRPDGSQSDVKNLTYDLCKKVLSQKGGLKKCKNTSTGEVLYSALNLLSGYNH